VLRTRTYRSWRPAVGLFVMIGTFLVVSTAITLVTLLPTILADPDPALRSDELVGDVVSTPLGLLGVNLSLAVLIPAAMLGLLAGHQIRPGFLHSVMGRFRWGFLTLCLLVEGVVWLLTLPLTVLLAGDTEGVPAPGDVGGLSLTQWLPFALVILLTTPLQAAGEEYGFRGYGLQALGAWVRNPWFAIIVTSVLFALAHGGQSLPLFLDRLAFGVVAGLLTVRTGGLEAAIAFHVVNNMIILLLASAAGQLEPSLTVSEAPWGLVVADVAGMALYTVVVLWLAHRRGLLTTTAPAPAPWPVPARWTSVAPPGAPG
jgi:membrane protease YdiL (CAAX protease family)